MLRARRQLIIAGQVYAAGDLLPPLSSVEQERLIALSAAEVSAVAESESSEADEKEAPPNRSGARRKG